MSKSKKSFYCCDCIRASFQKHVGRIGTWAPIEPTVKGEPCRFGQAQDNHCCPLCGYYAIKIYLDEDKYESVLDGERVESRWIINEKNKNT